MVAEAAISASHNDYLFAVGWRAEEDFLRLASDRGLSAENCASRRKAYDFVVNGFRVQVKHRTCKSSAVIQLCKARRPGEPKLAYYRDEFDILALRCDGVWYLIDAKTLVAEDGDTLINNLNPSHYKEFIENWGVFTDEGVRRNSSQLLLKFDSQ